MTTLEELTIKDNTYIDSTGQRVDVSPVGAPTIVTTGIKGKESFGGTLVHCDKEGDRNAIRVALLRESPEGANAYVAGEGVEGSNFGLGCRDYRVWVNLPVMYFKINQRH